MEDPADGIVNELGLGVCLVTALVGNYPKTGSDETSPEGIQRPKGELSGPIKDRIWELNDFRVDAGI